MAATAPIDVKAFIDDRPVCRSGPSSDRFGRKPVLILSVLLFGLLTVATAYSHSPTEMALLRLLTGIGLGAAMPNATTLLAEYAPAGLPGQRPVRGAASPSADR